MKETVETRDRAGFLVTLVHDEWLETVMSGRLESYQEWTSYAAWLILNCLPEQGQ